MNIEPKDLQENIFKMIADKWMLITAGDKKHVNTMTASFGGFGVLFFKNVAHIYVRPERYTYDFLERSNTFSLSFFDEKYRKQLSYCGKVSGRQENKIKTCGFQLEFNENTPYFNDAQTTIFCKKIYRQDIQEDCFIDKEAFYKTYSTGGIHRMYIGEITDIIIK